MRRWHGLFAALAFGVPLAAYVRTLTPTVPFWDSGEFIATSYILGLPHPPGNPVYTMLGRVLSVIPFETVAWRVNFMSAFASALAVLFTFLVTARAMRRTFGNGPLTPMQWLCSEIGGLTAAFFLAFSSSFWESAVEAEVYSLSSFGVIFSIWLAFNWWDNLGRKGNDLLLVLIVYLLSVSTGVHLGTILVAPGLLLLFWIIRPSYFMDGRFWLGAATIGFFFTMLVLDEMFATFDIPGVVFLVWFVGVLLLYLMYPKRLIRNNLFTWWTLAIVIGFTVQFFLLIRSQQHPMINEGAPATFEAWKDYLLRKQYGPSNPFVRRADLGYQISHMYLRYVWQQLPLVGSLGPFGPDSGWVRLINFLPYTLFFLGGVTNALREKKTFTHFLVQNLVMGPGLIFYLNFTDHEVRERDYFFTNSYHFIAIWMGMGAGWLLYWLGQALAPESEAEATAAASAAAASAAGTPGGAAPTPGPALVLPRPARTGLLLGSITLVGASLLPMKAGWYTHDRSDFYIAHDYAYNMLTPLEKNAIVFTNGDNDTFPLWYIQEVEGVRKDVRVVNLSLLNTSWYIRQLRDQEPKVPITWSDAELGRIGPYIDERTQKVVWVKDMAAANIIGTNEWRKPIYLAVTVPEQLGLERRLTLEGLVYRVHPNEVGLHVIDVQKTIDNLYRIFKYRGLLDKNRRYDASVYKDENAQRLVQNYSAAHIQVAYQLEQEGRLAEAVNLMRDAAKMTPDFPGIHEYLGRLYEEAGDYALAEQSYRTGLAREPGAVEYPFLLGSLLYERGHAEGNPALRQEGIALLRRSTELNQQYFDWFGTLFSALWTEGRREEAVEVLRTWIRAHPEDSQRQGLLREYEDSLRAAPRTGARARG
jgi:tetratricopeptide (TPR) repeat protein